MCPIYIYIDLDASDKLRVCTNVSSAKFSHDSMTCILKFIASAIAC